MSLAKNINRIQSYTLLNNIAYNTFIFSHSNKKFYSTESNENAGLKFAIILGV